MATSKHAGKKSLAQNDFLGPSKPIINSASDVGTGRLYNDGAVTVTFSLPAGSQSATSYTVTSSPGSYTASGSSSPLTVTGLQSETGYTFTVTAANASGVSPVSDASNSVTATTVPAQPAPPTVSSPSAGADSVSWSPPATGGKPISNYHWTSSDGKSGDTASTSVSVGQEMGTAQTYAVYATNANGNSVVSSNSASVTTTFGFFGVFGFFGAFSPFSPFSPFSVFGFFGFGNTFS